MVCVRDTGSGIPPEEIPHVFERFYSGSRGQKGENKGNGLGLAIAKKIIDAHHFKIRVESEVNRGTIVSIHMPLSETSTARTEK